MAGNAAPKGRKGRVLRKVAVTLLFILLFYIVFSTAAALVAPTLIFSRSDVGAENLEIAFSDLGLPRTEVRFESGANELMGYYYEAEGAKGIVVFVHGFHSGADAHLPEILWFLDRGWSVFAFDGTGTRGSEGAGTVGLAQMKYDLLCALDFIKSSLPAQPVVLYGHSQGAYAAAAVLNDFPEIRAAALIAGFDSPLDIMMYHARARVGVLADTQYPFLALSNYLTFGAEGNESAASSINAGDTPVLIIDCARDEIVTEELRISTRGVTDPNAKVVSVDSGHSGAWLTDGAEEYARELEAELSELHEKYGADLPDEAIEDFRSRIDYARLWELGESFMERILALYDAAVR